MITFLETYNDRKRELDDFIYVMLFLEKQENAIKDGVSNFDTFFKFNKKRKINYQSLINILKSSFSLMLYNIIEFTIANLVDSIYDEIRSRNLSYVQVNESIKSLWREAIFQSAKDPNASYNTFLKKNKEIIDLILNKKLLEIDSKTTLPAGNLDLAKISSVMESHGIEMKIKKQNYRPDVFLTIKKQRNDLAHGTVSFEEASRIYTISDIEKNEKVIIGLLNELIKQVKDYLVTRKYLSVANDK